MLQQVVNYVLDVLYSTIGKKLDESWKLTNYVCAIIRVASDNQRIFWEIRNFAWSLNEGGDLRKMQFDIKYKIWCFREVGFESSDLPTLNTPIENDARTRIVVYLEVLLNQFFGTGFFF
jgi:hypothetical protein